MTQPPQTITNSIGMKLVLIPNGTFTMGFHHELKIINYYLGVTEVTQGQYEKVMGANPSWFQGNKVRGDSSNHPVEQVSRDDAVEFCKKLSDLPEEKKAGRVYRLPTEAEWEYACRAGSKTAFNFGESAESLRGYAWFAGNSGNQTHPVGEKKANAWGLYDMHGNVFEWSSDWYGEYPKGAVRDPRGPKGEGGSSRVIRGGGWSSGAAICWSACRSRCTPECRISNLGFRVALSSPEIPQSPEADK